jgi:hypothetical protein
MARARLALPRLQPASCSASGWSEISGSAAMGAARGAGPLDVALNSSAGPGGGAVRWQCAALAISVSRAAARLFTGPS